MRNPIQNLGHYTDYKYIEERAVSKATPKILIKGGIIGSVLTAGVFLGYAGYLFLKDRKEQMEFEAALQEEFGDKFQEDSFESGEEHGSDEDEANIIEVIHSGLDGKDEACTFGHYDHELVGEF